MLPAKAKPPNLHVSLKYWHAPSQCLSAWQPRELKKLRKFIETIQSFPREELGTGGLQPKIHKGKTSSGFALPTALSKDLAMYELRVDQKARVHGAFQNDVFFLVWLDRSHAVFPEGK
jgi:hypothetical protein